MARGKKNMSIEGASEYDAPEMVDNTENTELENEGCNTTSSFELPENGKVTVRYIERGNFSRDHLISGGMVDGAKHSFCVPMLKNGNLKNVLTKAEKEYFEELLDISLSTLKKPSENFWSTSNPSGIGNVILEKGDNVLDLSDPYDYLRYKVLLANSTYIASSYKEMDRDPKSTYVYVIVKESDVVEATKSTYKVKRETFKKLEEYDNNIDALTYIISVADHDEVDRETPIELIRDRVYAIFERSAGQVSRILNDRMFSTKVLIRKLTMADLVYVENDQYYMADSNKPMHRGSNEADLDEACTWLNLPENAPILADLKAKVKSK